MKVRTLPQIVELISKIDPESGVNEYMLTELIRQGILCYDKNGNRTVTDYDHVMLTLNRMLGMEDTAFPHVRLVNKALPTLADYGFGEDKVGRLVAEGKVDCIRIGNRSYIAFEQFDWPYAERIFTRMHAPQPRESAKHQAQEQVSEFIATHQGAPVVKRKRGGNSR